MPALNEEFLPAYNAPMLPGEAQLDFESMDAGGIFSALEASLKSLVDISTTSKHVATAARGKSGAIPRRVHGVSGMAGAGKTIALIGLLHDVDIKEYSIDGVLYINTTPVAALRSHVQTVF